MKTYIFIALGVIYGATLWTVLGYAIGKRSGEGTSGAILGLFLGPLGCAIALASSPRPAPSNASTVRDYEKWKQAHPQTTVR